MRFGRSYEKWNPVADPASAEKRWHGWSDSLNSEVKKTLDVRSERPLKSSHSRPGRQCKLKSFLEAGSKLLCGSTTENMRQGGPQAVFRPCLSNQLPLSKQQVNRCSEESPLVPIGKCGVSEVPTFVVSKRETNKAKHVKQRTYSVFESTVFPSIVARGLQFPASRQKVE